MPFKNHHPLPIAFLLIFFVCLSCKEDIQKGILIENINIIDPLNGLTKNQSVSIVDTKITSTSDYNPKAKSKYSRIINGEGKYLIPGLWDAHVHFAYIEELAESMLDLFIVYGVTSVRDTGGKIDFVTKWKKKAQENPLTAPRVMIAGPLLDGLPNVYDGSSSARPPLSVGLDSEEEIESTVKSLIDEGVDLLKAYEMLTPDQLKSIARLSEASNLRLTGHVPLSMNVEEAVNAGLNSIEHLRNIELSTASNHAELLEQRKKLLFDGRSDPGGILRSRIHAAQREFAIENYDQTEAKKVLDILKDKDVWQIPTLALIHSFASRPFLREEFKESFTLLPDSIEQAWIKRGNIDVQSPLREFSSVYDDWVHNMTKQMHEKEIPILAGTDCPIHFLTPGFSLHEELYELVEAGMSPLDAIRSATYQTAKYFKLDSELGLIKEGFLADLLILERNPLEDIRNTTSINAVIKNGNVIDSNKLQGIKKELSLK